MLSTSVEMSLFGENFGLKITPLTEKYLSKLHTLKFYILCPDGRRFSTDDLEKEFARKPDGIFLNAFSGRLIVVLEAVFPAEPTAKRSLFNISGRLSNYLGSYNIVTGERVEAAQEIPYWRQVFYLSSGTSITSWKELESYETAKRTNTWMPFQGIVIKAYMDNKNSTTTPIQRTVQGFYFEKSASFSTYSFLADRSEDLDVLYESIPYFLPESGYPVDFMAGQDNFTQRMCTISYLLASHAMGGNAYTKELYSNLLEDYQLRWKSWGDNFGETLETIPLFVYMPQVITLDKQKKQLHNVYPLIGERIKKFSPPKLDYSEIIAREPPTKAKDVNDFIDKHGAIGRMNVFRALGDPQIPVPGLSVASLPIAPLSYALPIQEYNSILNRYVSSIFVEFIQKKITVQECIARLQWPMEKILEELKSRNPGSTILSPATDQFTLTFHQGKISNENKPYTGGRRNKKRTRRGHARKQLRKKTRRSK